MKKIMLRPNEFNKEDLWKVRIAAGSCKAMTPEEQEEALYPAAQIIVQNILSTMKVRCGKYKAQSLYMSEGGNTDLVLTYLDGGNKHYQNFSTGAFLEQGSFAARNAIFVMALSEALERWPKRIGNWQEDPQEGVPKEYPFYAWDLKE